MRSPTLLRMRRHALNMPRKFSYPIEPAPVFVRRLRLADRWVERVRAALHPTPENVDSPDG